MARGDVKTSRSRGYSGGGGSYTEYDDEGRGRSKIMWEAFQRNFELNGYNCNWLFGEKWQPLDGYQHITYTTYRYNVADGPRYWHSHESYDMTQEQWERRLVEEDSRMARLIKQKCGDKVWLAFYKSLLDLYNEHKKELERNQAERNVYWNLQQSAERAKQIVVKREETEAILKDVELVAGALRSDFEEALRYREAYGLRDGDWLDDPVEAVTVGYGFGEEIRERAGVRLQVTVSLDMSNSMRYNNIAGSAVLVFRDLFLALKGLQEENESDMFTAAFTFSDGDDGKGASRADHVPSYPQEGDLPYGMNRFRKLDSWSGFQGEDTWLYPLFEQIEKWENNHSDPGAVRLDLVITDAVLEHPKDIRESDKIQERRDGAMQTVLLNLLPEKEWVNSTLPLRCVQYPVNVDNIGGVLRQVLSEFLSVHI